MTTDQMRRNLGVAILLVLGLDLLVRLAVFVEIASVDVKLSETRDLLRTTRRECGLTKPDDATFRSARAGFSTH